MKNIMCINICVPCNHPILGAGWVAVEASIKASMTGSTHCQQGNFSYKSIAPTTNAHVKIPMLHKSTLAIKHTNSMYIVVSCSHGNKSTFHDPNNFIVYTEQDCRLS